MVKYDPETGPPEVVLGAALNVSGNLAVPQMCGDMIIINWGMRRGGSGSPTTQATAAYSAAWKFAKLVEYGATVIVDTAVGSEGGCFMKGHFLTDAPALRDHMRAIWEAHGRIGQYGASRETTIWGVSGDIRTMTGLVEYDLNDILGLDGDYYRVKRVETEAGEADCEWLNKCISSAPTPREPRARS
jgi:hypothetical protein